MGLASAARDLGLSWSRVIQTDADAATGVCLRRRLGIIRKFSTAELWTQDQLRCTDVGIVKLPGDKTNVVDMLAKHVGRATLERHLVSMWLREAHGRAESVPAIENSSAMFVPPSTPFQGCKARRVHSFGGGGVPKREGEEPQQMPAEDWLQVTNDDVVHCRPSPSFIVACGYSLCRLSLQPFIGTFQVDTMFNDESSFELVRHRIHP